jgi:hypothetical protein
MRRYYFQIVELAGKRKVTRTTLRLWPEQLEREFPLADIKRAAEGPGFELKKHKPHIKLEMNSYIQWRC